MKTTIKFFSVLAVLTTLFFSSCKKDEVTKDPVADFTISPNDTLNAGETFTFTNTSTDADTYLWDFGDGTTSTQVSPTKSTFNVEVGGCGNSFAITLTASKNGKSSTISKSVVVNYCE